MLNCCKGGTPLAAPLLKMGRPGSDAPTDSNSFPVLTRFGQLFLQHLTRSLPGHAEVDENLFVL
jgi:hypothetical protein